MLRYACERFAEVDDLPEDCLCGKDAVSEDELEGILDAASDAVVMATKQAFGRCTQTVRPCQAHPVCGRNPCGCCMMRGFKLAGFDPFVDEVLIDGEVVSPSTYAIIRQPNGDRMLERFKATGEPDYWPACQNLNVGDGEVGAFAVMYTAGLYVDQLVINATVEIACDILSHMDTKRTDLPRGATSVSMQGVTIDTRRYLAATATKGSREELTMFPWLQRLAALYPPASDSFIWSPEIDDGWNLFRR